MNANLLLELNEITIRNYSYVEEKGIIQILISTFPPKLTFEFEEDEDGENNGQQVLVLKGNSLQALLSFLANSKIPVTIIR